MRAERRRGARYYVEAVLGSLALLALSPLLLPLLLAYGAHHWLWGSLLKWRFRRTWGSRGKAGILVYSDSPNWKVN